MEDYDSIRNFATECESLARIDMVILNAGLQKTTFRRARTTGHELHVQINYISTALLTILLLPVLKAKRPPSDPPVLSIVS